MGARRWFSTWPICVTSWRGLRQPIERRPEKAIADSGEPMRVENCSDRKINVLLGGSPRTHADSHGGAPPPCGAPAPASAGILDRSNDTFCLSVIPETDDDLIQDNLVQYFNPGLLELVGNFP